MIWNFVHSYNSSMIRSNYNPLSKPNNTTRKKVSFDQMVRVILIPHLNTSVWIYGTMKMIFYGFEDNLIHFEIFLKML